MVLYVNGSQVATAKAPGVLTRDPSQGMEIGADDGGGVANYNSPFVLNGALDEIRLYRRALSAEDIRAIAESAEPPPADDPDLVLYHVYDAGGAMDMAGRGNDGVMPSGAKSVDGRYGKAALLGGKGGRPVRRGPKRGLYSVSHDWSVQVPLLVRGMVAGPDSLIVAGPPDILDEEDAAKTFGAPETQQALRLQRDILRGARGGTLRRISKADGSTLAEVELDTMPVWDGLSAAGGAVYLSATDGSVRCLGGR